MDPLFWFEVDAKMFKSRSKCAMLMLVLGGLLSKLGTPRLFFGDIVFNGNVFL
jgi:hypothetical protein